MEATCTSASERAVRAKNPQGSKGTLSKKGLICAWLLILDKICTFPLFLSRRSWKVSAVHFCEMHVTDVLRGRGEQ